MFYYELEITSEAGEVDQMVFTEWDFYLGYAGCFSNYSLGFGETISMRARAVDLSGNAGDWTTAEDYVAKNGKGVGCSTVGLAGLSLPSLLVVLLGLRRRRE